MTFLFIFAHPDDESISCAGTIKLLVEAGHKIVLVSATDGSAGEVLPQAMEALAREGTLADLRRQELKHAAQFLGVHELLIWEFEDGAITNAQVWGVLRDKIKNLIDEHRPEFVVTFDHSGWYFHLDHVGVSIATTLAFESSSHRPEGLLLSHVRVKKSKWPYIIARELPITHVVDVSTHRELKLKVLATHASQDTTPIDKKVIEEKPHYELFELVKYSEKAQQFLTRVGVFKHCSKKLCNQLAE